MYMNKIEKSVLKNRLLWKRKKNFIWLLHAFFFLCESVFFFLSWHLVFLFHSSSFSIRFWWNQCVESELLALWHYATRKVKITAQTGLCRKRVNTSIGSACFDCLPNHQLAEPNRTESNRTEHEAVRAAADASVNPNGNGNGRRCCSCSTVPLAVPVQLQ